MRIVRPIYFSTNERKVKGGKESILTLYRDLYGLCIRLCNRSQLHPTHHGGFYSPGLGVLGTYKKIYHFKSVYVDLILRTLLFY